MAAGGAAPTQPRAPVQRSGCQILTIGAISDCNESLTTADATSPMASITIRNLDPAVKERLRVRAARHGRSMEDEARRILREATGILNCARALPTSP